MEIHNRDGFTLIEVMVAMAVLAIGIITLFIMENMAIKGNARANNLTRASVIGSEAIEQLMQIDFDDSVFDADAANNPHTNSEVPTLLFQRPVTSITWDVIDWSDDTVDNDGDGATDEFDERGMKYVTVNVHYTVGKESKQTTLNFLKVELL